MDQHDPATVFSSIDEMGRYAYANQPKIALWNLTRFAESLLPLLDEDKDKAVAQAEEALVGFAAIFNTAYKGGLRHKLGLFTERDDDPGLAQDLLNAMKQGKADFTLTFRRLSDAAGDGNLSEVRALFEDASAFDAWAPRWLERIALEPQSAAERRTAMRAVNPAFIPRNHRVEAVIRAAVDRDDFAPFEELLTVLSKPFEDQPQYAAYMQPPEPEQRVLQTFCGT